MALYFCFCVLLVFLFLSHAVNTAKATSEGYASALQMQDTVRSSLRSEDTAQALRDLVANNRVALQQLKDAIDGQGQQLKESAKMSAEKTTALEKTIGELKSYGAFLVLGLVVPAVVFVFSFPQRVVSMLKAYMGHGLMGHGPAQHPSP